MPADKERRVLIRGPQGVELIVLPGGGIAVSSTPSPPPAGTWVVFRTTAAGGEASRVGLAAPCQLRDVYGGNNSGADAYLQIHNAVALPANGTVPYLPPVFVPNGQQGWYDFAFDAIDMTTGLTLAFSTTLLTLTVVAGGCDFGGRLR